MSVLAVAVSRCVCNSFLHRLTKMSTRWFASYGFSIGIEDVTPTFSTKECIVAGYAECDEVITKFNSGKLERLAGCDADQTLESTMNGILGRIRNQVRATLATAA